MLENSTQLMEIWRAGNSPPALLHYGGAYMNHELLTVKEAAEILRVSETTIWRMFKDGRLKSISLGGLRRISREELNRMLKYGIDTHSA